LTILRLQRSVTVVLEVSNAEGSASRTWSVKVPLTTTTTTTTTTTNTVPVVVLPGADTLVEEEAAPPTARMGLGGILGLIFGLLFGVILVAAAFFTCRPRERPKAINSRSSSKRNSAVFPPAFDDKTTPLLKQPILRQGSGRRVDPPPTNLSTFGQANSTSKRPMSIEDQVKIYLGDQVDNPGEVVRITPKKGEVDYPGVHAKHAKARPDITLSSASLSSAADTDDLSSLGVPVSRPKSKDLHDPLGSWDDLEPELNNRRSHTFDMELDLTRADISLTGPTGYPVMSPTSPSSPLGGSMQRVHYHYPEGRERSMERKKSLDRTANGRARSQERPHSRARTPTHI